MNRHEERVIEFESARNEAADSYFGERPQIDRTIERERIFESGFRMAWESFKKPQGCEAEKSNQVKRRQRNFIALCDNLLATFCKRCNGKGVQSWAIERVEFTSCRLCQKEGADNAAEAMHRAAHALSFAMVMSLSDRQMGKVSAQFLALQDAILMWRRQRREEKER